MKIKPIQNSERTPQSEKHPGGPSKPMKDEGELKSWCHKQSEKTKNLPTEKLCQHSEYKRSAVLEAPPISYEEDVGIERLTGRP